MLIFIYKVLLVISCMGLMFYGIYQVKRVEYYAWNMPEAYMPAKAGAMLMFISGILLGILIATPSN